MRSGAFAARTESGGQDSHFCIHNIYRYEDLFQTRNRRWRLFKDVPFLNGGLFECLDQARWSSTEQHESVGAWMAFRTGPTSRSFAERVVLRRRIHSGPQRGLRHQGQTYKTKGLIHILNSYKFTVDENTPVEEEVALDPELLGKVFENLLASYNPETSTTARKQTGSFYTPREIVDYMVDELLAGPPRQSLEPQVDAPSPEIQARLRPLLSYSDEDPGFSAEEIATLIAAIDHIKVLDPACGSGAFPMGMLLKLVHMLGKLDPGNHEWKKPGQGGTIYAMPSHRGRRSA